MSDIASLADAVKDAIVATWAPTGDDTASRGYQFTFDLETMTGRHVRVLPASYGFPEPSTRASDVEELAVVVVVAERYADAGPVPDAWVDERVDFVETHVVALDDSRNAELAGGFYAWSSEVSPVYDLDELRQRNLFLSTVRLTFRKLT